MSAPRKLGNVLLLATVMFGLVACGSDNDDLDVYINDVKARPGGRIEPLPEITPYEGFTYIADAEGLRSPFVPDTPQVSTSVPVAGFVLTLLAVVNSSKVFHSIPWEWSELCISGTRCMVSYKLLTA